MNFTGLLQKMKGTWGNPVIYQLYLGEEIIEMNPLIGLGLKLEWTGRIFCLRCGKNIQKTFADGLCYQCFTEAPEAAPCILRPELCRAQFNEGRDVEWELAHHFQPHVVYLAQTNNIKIGVTRASQVPSRWIDQGADKAIVFANTPYRQLAGAIEIEMKQFLSDRTDWRKMLSNSPSDQSLEECRIKFGKFLPPSLSTYLARETEAVHLNYPVLSYPSHIASVKLENPNESQGKLTGIRGQYLYFNSKCVMNIRKYSGYEVKFST